MPEPTPESTDRRSGRSSADTDELRRRVADLVLRHPGVVRIEPTLSSALRSLAEGHDPADAVRLDVRSRVADVELSVATDAGHQAREVAHRVRDAVAELVGGAGLVAGAIEIHVLSIEGTDPVDPARS